MKLLVLVICIFLITQTNCLYGSNSKVFKLDTKNFNKEVIQSKNIWLVEFFAPWCGHCKSLAPEWEKAANALEGIVRVGAVDMTTDQSVGGPYDVKGFPTLKFFGENKNSPLAYEGARTAQEIVNYALDQVKKIALQKLSGKSGGKDKKDSGSKSSGSSSGNSDEKDVIVLDQNNFDTLLMQSTEPWFVEFYAPWCGHCKQLAPHWNKLATELKKDGIKVAKVDATENQNLAQKYGVKGYPTIKWFQPGNKNSGEVLDYGGARETDAMAEWARQKFQVPAKFLQLIDQDTFNENCVQYQGVSVIVFLPHIFDTSAEERNAELSVGQKVAKLNRGKPFNFVWSEGGSQQQLEEVVNVGGSGYPAVVAISAKKEVFSSMRGSFSEKNLDIFLKELTSGKAYFQKISKWPVINKVEQWDGKDRKPDIKEELITEDL